MFKRLKKTKRDQSCYFSSLEIMLTIWTTVMTMGKKKNETPYEGRIYGIWSMILLEAYKAGWGIKNISEALKRGTGGCLGG